MLLADKVKQLMDIQRAQAAYINPRTRLGYTAIKKLKNAQMLPKTYFDSTQEIGKDFESMRSVMRDMSLNNPIFNALKTFIVSNLIGSQGVEILWRTDGDTKRELNQRWNTWQYEADATGRLPFLNLETTLVSEYITTGELLLVKDSELGLSMVESERIIDIQQDKRGRIKSFIISNGKDESGEEKTEVIKAENCFYIANYTRPSQRRGSPWFASSADSILLLASITRSMGFSWLRVSKTPIAVTSENGKDDFLKTNESNPDSEQSADETPLPEIIDTGEGEAVLYIAPNGAKLDISAMDNVPGSNFSSSMLAMVRIIASSQGISADSVLGSFENYSFSSSKASWSLMQTRLSQAQSLFIYSFYRPLVKWLLSEWGYQDIDFDCLLPSITPLDESAYQSAVDARRTSGMSTYSEELQKQNKSREETIEVLKQETIDAINVSNEVYKLTGHRIPYQHFAGLPLGKTEAAVIASEATEEVINESIDL